jgi:tetratricopeptide (TPR) repeat protein
MKMVLQDFTPYDRSLQWHLCDAYYAQRGLEAWTGGDIPYLATNNRGQAQKMAELTIALESDLVERGRRAPDDELWVLEVGGGVGEFAANFVRALDEDCGEAGRSLGRRLRYLFSDRQAATVRAALETEALHADAAAGRVLGAVCDLRRPRELALLDGRPPRARPQLAIVNYVCCVAPPKLIRRLDGRYEEKLLQVTIDAPDGADRETLTRDLLERATTPGLFGELTTHAEWRPFAFSDPLYARALHALLDRFAEATVAWPHVFVEFLRALPLAPGGAFLINDYGVAEVEDLEGLKERAPVTYGNSVSHLVDFAVFDELAREAGWSLERTRDPLRSIHTVALRLDREPAPAFARTFAALAERDDGELLIELTRAARIAAERKEPLSAARLFRRCARIDPSNAEWRYHLGAMCIDAGRARLAAQILVEGKALDHAGAHDFDFQLGRAAAACGRTDEAIACYEASLDRDPRAVTFANLGGCFLQKREYPRAHALLLRALALDPGLTVAEELIQQLRDAR